MAAWLNGKAPVCKTGMGLTIPWEFDSPRGLWLVGFWWVILTITSHRIITYPPLF